MQRWWPMVTKGTLHADFRAGMAGTIILLPQAVAYATIAGLPPEFGSYTAIVPVVVSALFGSSWHLVSGPTAAISIVVFATISPLAEPGSAAYINLLMTLTFLVGIFTLALGIMRMGVLVNFISHSVVIGFTAGAAILIAVSQLKNFFGLKLPTGGSFYSTLTRSGINYTAGARTPLASVFSAMLLVLTLLLFAPLVRYLPIASMASLLFMVAYSLIDFHHIKIVTRTSHSESAVLFTTLLATLFLELEFAIYAGVILSLILFLDRTAHPTIRDAVPAPDEGSYHFIPQTNQPDCCQLKMVFIDGAIYFGAVDHVQQTFRSIDETNPAQKHSLVLAPGISFVDIAGAELLSQEARRRRLMAGSLYFHRLKEPIVDTLAKGGYLDQVGRENLFSMGQDVIAAIYPKLDSEVCRHCKAKIFKQCHVALPNGEPR